MEMGILLKKEILFTDDKKALDEKHVGLFKTGNNNFQKSLQNKYGVYFIKLDNALRYIGCLHEKTRRLNYRVSQHFTLSKTSTSLCKKIMNVEEVDIAVLHDFYDMTASLNILKNGLRL